MAKRCELTDAVWARLRPLYLGNGQRDGQWRGVATRYEKRARNYRAMVVLDALMLWLA
jgi:transposase